LKKYKIIVTGISPEQPHVLLNRATIAEVSGDNIER